MPEAPFGQPLPFRRLLDDAARRALRHLRSIYLPVALPMAVANALLAALQVRWMSEFLALAEGQDPSALAASFGSFGCAMLLFWALFVVASNAMSAAVVDSVAGRPVSLAARWRFVLRPAVLGTLLLMTLLVGLGFLFCILPGIYLLLRFSFTLPVMVEEELRGTAALGRSGELAHFNPRRQLLSSPILKILALMVVGYVLSTALSLLVQVPFMVVQQVMTLREITAGGEAPLVSAWQWLNVPATFFGGLVQWLVVLYMSFGVALLYFDIRRRREGHDLEAALDELLGPGEAAPGVWAMPFGEPEPGD